jgi:hypothetical protein
MRIKVQAVNIKINKTLDGFAEAWVVLFGEED